MRVAKCRPRRPPQPPPTGPLERAQPGAAPTAGGAGGAGFPAGLPAGRAAPLPGAAGVGTITNLTATGFTLHSANGTDIKVTFGSGATVRMTVAGQITDLKDNVNVTVTGARDASGNITATAITIVPAPAASPAAGG